MASWAGVVTLLTALFAVCGMVVFGVRYAMADSFTTRSGTIANITETTTECCTPLPQGGCTNYVCYGVLLTFTDGSSCMLPPRSDIPGNGLIPQCGYRVGEHTTLAMQEVPVGGCKAVTPDVLDQIGFFSSVAVLGIIVLGVCVVGMAYWYHDAREKRALKRSPYSYSALGTSATFA